MTVGYIRDISTSRQGTNRIASTQIAVDALNQELRSRILGSNTFITIRSLNVMYPIATSPDIKDVTGPTRPGRFADTCPTQALKKRLDHLVLLRLS